MIGDIEEAQLEGRVEQAAQPKKQESASKRVTFVDVLRNRNFRNLWLGQIVSQIGDYFVFLALTVVVSGFSKDAQETSLSVAVLLISFSLPRLLFGLLAGVFVDRWDRRKTMLVSDLVRAALTLLMIPALIVASLPMILALSFTMSAVGTLFNPAKSALIPRLVPSEQLLSANSLSQTSQVLATLLGPALAGVTLTVAGAGNEWVAFVVDSASFLVSAFTIWLIRIVDGRRKRVAQDSPVENQSPSTIYRPPSAIAGVWHELKVGLRAVVLNRTIAITTVIMTVTMLGVGAINVLWVVFLKTQFGYVGPELAWRLSLLDIMFGVGMIISSVVVGNMLSGLAPKWLIVESLVGVGVPLLVFGYLSDYWLLAVVTFVMGFFVGPINTGVGTLIQIAVPNRLLGRVGGGIGTVVETSTILSMSLAGVAGAALGIPIVFALAGALCIAMGIASWGALPALTLKDKVADS